MGELVGEPLLTAVKGVGDTWAPEASSDMEAVVPTDCVCDAEREATLVFETVRVGLRDAVSDLVRVREADGQEVMLCDSGTAVAMGEGAT